MMGNDQQMDGVPILVFEEMKSSYDGGGLTLLSEDRLAKATSGPIDEKGALAGLPKRLDHIKRVHVVFSSEKQVYIVGDLHRTPHYSILQCQLECFLQSLEVRRLDYNVYHRHRSYVEECSFIKVYNVFTKEFRGLHSLIKDLRLGEMQAVLNKPPLLVCKRNNYQVSCGYSCQAFQPRSSFANRHESKPALTNATKQHEDKFVIMSRISQKLNLPIACTGKQSSSFNERQADFAREIHKKQLLRRSNDRHVLYRRTNAENALRRNERDGTDLQFTNCSQRSFPSYRFQRIIKSILCSLREKDC